VIRRVGLLKRRPDMTQDEFFAYWIETHAALARQVVGLRGYRINRLLGQTPPMGWDGLGELWFDSPEAAEEGLAGTSDLARRIDDDLRRFVGERVTFYTQSHVILPPPLDT
jgi:uncharacterized protein (TIGR02118 family)